MILARTSNLSEQSSQHHQYAGDKSPQHFLLHANDLIFIMFITVFSISYEIQIRIYRNLKYFTQVNSHLKLNRLTRLKNLQARKE